MTLYWWTHWFWITASGRRRTPAHSSIDDMPLATVLRIQLLLGIVLCAVAAAPAQLRDPSSIGQLDTKPFLPPATRATDGSHEPLSFPRLADVSGNNDDDGGSDDADADADVDADDVFNGRLRDQISFHEEWQDAAAALLEGKQQQQQQRDVIVDQPPQVSLSASTTAKSIASSSSSGPPSSTTAATTATASTTVAAEIITTRLSTRKTQRKKIYADRSANVTRVNVTMIRYTTIVQCYSNCSV